MRTFENISKLVKSKRQLVPGGLSQNDLSVMLGYKNGQFISNVERGLCSIPYKNLKKLSEILNVPKEDLKAAILKDVEVALNYHLDEQEEVIDEVQAEGMVV